ncbi:MAG: T9SS type A sorting domain-containing protein [Vicingaceae bacterium]|nr:T9SS type A sorting domain-containing protein [Vicingaceae bacterium]
MSIIKQLFIATLILSSLDLVAQNKKNFYDIQSEMNQYFDNKKIDFSGDGEWRQFKRWEAFMEQRVFPTGYFADPAATWEAYANEAKKKSTLREKKSNGLWTYLGPENYQGRVNCIVIDPNNTNTFWLGGATSGVWKTTNGGALWTDISNNMPVINIADIVINPTNSNEIYVATGDNYGWGGSAWQTFFGYSMGILKSIDGGNTWNPTGLSWNLPQTTTMRRLIINTSSPTTLIAATSQGIYKTIDGGANWTLAKSGSIIDIDYHPTNKNIVYAVNDSVFKSTDGGTSWNHVSGSPIFNPPTNHRYWRGSIAVTPKAPSNVYVLYSELNNSGFLYKSTNSGNSFSSLVAPTSSEVNGYLGYYTGVLEVSPVDTNRIIVGGTSLAITQNESITWTTTSNTFVDQHAVTFLPDGINYIGANDGGVYKRIPSLVSMNGGLRLTQFYRMGAAATDSNIIYGGRQDGGTLKYSGGANSWSYVYNQDGTEAIVDYTNANNVYASYQYGNFAKSTNGGATFSPIPTPMGYWKAPMVIHPTNPQILFYGGPEVSKSIDGGLSWNDISTGLSTCWSLAVAKSNPNYIYASSSWNTINMTTNGGTNWNNISAGLPLAAISYIAISPTDPNKAWIVFSGFLSGDKVYKTINAGQTWTNISGSLPNIPINCIEFDDNSTNEALYIGTDIGVYYRDNSLSDWTFLNNGLPPVIISELEIHYASSKIRAATFGRGMWEAPLQNTTTNINKIEPINTFSIFPNPSRGMFYIDLDFIDLDDVHIVVTNTLGQIIINNNAKHKRIELDLSNYPNGIYNISIISSKITETRKVILNKR